MSEIQKPVAIVTGASSGIGQWTALGLAKAGMQVTLVGRSAARLEQTANWIARETRTKPSAIEMADFASLRAVQSLGERLADRLPRIHLLVNNAGGAWVKRELSADGYEMTFAVNHLAPFLLTRILLPGLKDAVPARIVNLASTAHLRGHIDFADLMSVRHYGVMRAYSQSKLANVMFTVALARRLEGSGVVTNCVHPGVVATRFGEKGGAFGLLWRMAKPFLMTSEQGAQETLRTALDADRGSVSGRYFAKGREAATNREAADPQAVEKLWLESERLVDAALAGSKVPA